MVKLCQKMFASGVSAADNVATIIVPQPLTLVLLQICCNTVNAGAVGSALLFQFSTMSSSTFTSNDVRSVIAEFYAGNDKAINFNGVQNVTIPIAGIRFSAGDVIRMHRTVQTAPTSCVVAANLYFV